MHTKHAQINVHTHTHTGASCVADGHSPPEQCGGVVQPTQLPGAKHIHLPSNLPSAVRGAQDRRAGRGTQGGESAVQSRMCVLQFMCSTLYIHTVL